MLQYKYCNYPRQKIYHICICHLNELTNLKNAPNQIAHQIGTVYKQPLNVSRFSQSLQAKTLIDLKIDLQAIHTAV